MNQLLSDYIRRHDVYPSENQKDLIESKLPFLIEPNESYGQILSIQDYIDKIDKAAELLMLLYRQGKELVTKNDIAIVLLRNSIAQKSKELRILQNQFESIVLYFTDNNSLLQLLKEEYAAAFIDESNVEVYNGLTLSFEGYSVTPISKSLNMFGEKLIKQSGSLDSLPLEIQMESTGKTYLEFTYRFDKTYVNQLSIQVSSYHNQDILIYIDGNYHSKNVIDRKANLFPINIECTEIKLQLVSDKGYYYIDSLEFINISGKQEGYAVTGPYQLGPEISQFMIEPCVTVTDLSDVYFQYSIDLTNWFFLPINQVVYLQNFTEITGDKIDIEELFAAPIKPSDFTLENEEYILNAKYSALGVLIVKRNLNNQSSYINGISSGWHLDLDTMQYVTYLDNPIAFDLDIGNIELIVNGNSFSNTVTLSSGINKINIDALFWNEVPDLLSSEEELSSQDPLYPHNGKLLIEGYKYSSNFTGNKVYPDKREIFAHLMINDSQSNVNSYATLTDNEFFYIKIFDDLEETYSVSNVSYKDESKQLYVKTILNGSEDEIPFAHNFVLKAI